MTHIVPRGTLRFLRDYAGTNPYHKPKWRLSVASDVLIKESGVWRDWDESLSTSERGGLNFTDLGDFPGVSYRQHANKPLRVVTEMRETQRYPHLQGWILEKWYPATAYGSREEWISHKAADGVTPILGAYPEEGCYEMQYGPWEKIPSTDILRNCIAGYSKQFDNRLGTPQSRLREYALRYQYEQEQAATKRKAEYAYVFKDHLTPMHSSSLAASRWRNQLAENIGDRSHVGIL